MTMYVIIPRSTLLRRITGRLRHRVQGPQGRSEGPCWAKPSIRAVSPSPGLGASEAEHPEKMRGVWRASEF